MTVDKEILAIVIIYVVGCFVSLKVNHRLRLAMFPLVPWGVEDNVIFTAIFLVSWAGLIVSLIGFTIIKSSRW